jgi:uncharacterized protein
MRGAISVAFSRSAIDVPDTRPNDTRPNDTRQNPAHCAQPEHDNTAFRNAPPRLPFLIRRDGNWLYRGSVIGRKELICLFSSVLTRDADGHFWLETPAERGMIEVEDAPFLAVEMDWTGDGPQQELTFRTNVDELITAGPDHPMRTAHDLLTCEPTPYLRVRGHTAHPIEARISRAVYYELVALAVPGHAQGREMLGVWSRGQFFPLGELSPDEA